MSTLLSCKRKIHTDSARPVFFLIISYHQHRPGKYSICFRVKNNSLVTTDPRYKLPRELPRLLTDWETWKETEEARSISFVRFDMEGAHAESYAKQFDHEKVQLKNFLAFLSLSAEKFILIVNHKENCFSDDSAILCKPINAYLTMLKELASLNVKVVVIDPIWSLLDAFDVEPLSTWSFKVIYGVTGLSRIGTASTMEPFDKLVHLRWQDVEYSLFGAYSDEPYTLLPNCTSYFLPRPAADVPLVKSLPHGPLCMRAIDALVSFTGVRELYLGTGRFELAPESIKPSLYTTGSLEVYDGPLLFDNLILMIRENPRLRRIRWRVEKKIELRPSQRNELTTFYWAHRSLTKVRMNACRGESETDTSFGESETDTSLVSPEVERQKADALSIYYIGWCRLSLSIASLRANSGNPVRTSILTLASALQFTDPTDYADPLPLASPKHINLDKCLDTKFARTEIDKE